MKKFQANYVLTNPDFYLLNLVENPINTSFGEALNDIKRNFEITYPSKMSGYLKEQLGDLTKYPNFGVPANDFKKIAIEDINNELSVTKLVPTAIMRFQILLIELLQNNYLKFESEWDFNILLPNQKELEIFENITYREEMYGSVQVVGLNVLHLAIIDLHRLINDLLPSGEKLPTPFFSINQTIDAEKFVPSINAVNIDFSLFNTLEQGQIRIPNIIYVRTDFEDNLLLDNETD
jgi:hypothetical protein